MVVVLARGGFCPKDRRQHEGLAELFREIEVGYCRLVTISTDNLLETNEFRSAVGAHWPFLSDPGRKVQKDLDIAEYTDPIPQPDGASHDRARAGAGRAQGLRRLPGSSGAPRSRS